MPRPKYSIDEVSQEFNVEDFGLKDLSKSDIEHLGEIAIDYMKKRIAKGTGYSGFDLNSVPYSKEYIASLPFKAWGKKPRPVNMKLTGDMLGLLDITEIKGSRFKIGWDDETENAKAYNHNTGDTLPKRKFFGLTNAEMKQIIEQFKKETK